MTRSLCLLSAILLTMGLSDMPDTPSTNPGMMRRTGGRGNANVGPAPRKPVKRLIGVATTTADVEEKEQTDSFPIYWGGGAVPRPTKPAPREMVISGSSRGTAIPIPVGTARITGAVIGYKLSSNWLVTVYRLCEADQRMNLYQGTTKYNNDTSAASWIGNVVQLDGTQTTVHSYISSAWTDWDYAGFGRTLSVARFIPSAMSSSGLPTCTQITQTSVALDWTEQVVIAAGHLNDLTPSDGWDFTGKIEVTIDGVGSPNTFKWRENGGAWTTGVAITGSDQDLGSTGVDIAFGATTGHSLNDTWTIRSLSNPFMAAYFYCTSIRFGPYWDKSVFDQATWTASADVCDVDQDAGAGVDRLWSVNGELYGQSGRDILENIMRHCFGYLWAFGGKVFAALDTDKTADATLTEHDFMDGGKPTWSRIKKRQRVNRCVVWYTDTENNYVEASREDHSPDMTATDIRDTHERLSLCTSGAMAQRWATQRVNKDYLETILCKCSCHPEKTIDLGPGDRVDITSNTGLNATPFRVLSAKYNTKTGAVDLELRSYHADTVATGTSDENDPYDFQTYDPPDPPTACTRSFVEYGNPAGVSYVEPDEIQATGGWTLSNFTPTYVYSGVIYDYTVLTSSNTHTDECIAYYDFTGSVGSEVNVIIHVVARIYNPSSSPIDREWYLEYVTNLGTLQSFPLNNEAVNPGMEIGSDKYFRCCERIPLNSSATYHRLQIRASAGTGGTTGPWARIRRVHVIPDSAAFTPAIVFSERWTWTEHANADDTVDFYQLCQVSETGIVQPIRQIPQGNKLLDVEIFSNGDFITNSPFQNTYMYALGKDGTRIIFPEQDVSVEENIWEETITTTALASTQLADAATIDAATLNSVADTSFLRSDANDSLTGSKTLTITSGSEIDIASGATLDVNGAAALGDATSLVLPTASISGAGSGSGLNADQLDGVEGSAFLRSNASDSITDAATLTAASGTEIDIASGATLDVNGAFDASGVTSFLAYLMRWGPGTTLTVTANEVTKTGNAHKIDDGDVVDTINGAQGDWDWVIFRGASSSMTGTFNETGNIKLGSTTRVLSGRNDWILFCYNANTSKWCEIVFSDLV